MGVSGWPLTVTVVQVFVGVAEHGEALYIIPISPMFSNHVLII